MSTMKSLRHAIVLLVVAASTQNAMLHVQAAGIQSGPSAGAMYAGGMLFDEGDDTLYFTGVHYNEEYMSNTFDKVFSGGPDSDRSSCFVASMRLEQGEDAPNYEFNGIGDMRSFVNDVEQESCMTVGLHRPSQIVVLGTKESMSSSGPPLEGSLSVFDRNELDTKKLSEVTLVSQDNTMTHLVYPVAITDDALSKDFVYVVVLSSKDAKDNSDLVDETYPDWLKIQRYGSAFDMHVSKIKLAQDNGGAFDGISTGNIVASKEWTTEFPLDRKEDRVFIGGIIHKMTSDNKGLVIVVGSTRGSGEGYGLSDGDDEDGFVTVIDPSDGAILGLGAREGSEEDDIVTGVCDDPTDPNHFFIVGATEGIMGGIQGDMDSVNVPIEMLQPFVRQVKTDRESSDSDNLWTMQWPVTKGSRSQPAFGSAIDCAVDGGFVYVAGTVDDGASLVQRKIVTESQGGDDVWVAKIDKNNREVMWVTQLGSGGNDRLARYGGITIDNNGNPIIYGDTNGEIYRVRHSSEDEATVDMFVMSLDKNDGNILKKSEDTFVGGISNTQTDPDDVYDIPTFYPTSGPTTGSEDSNAQENNSEDSNSADEFPTESPTYTPTEASEEDSQDIDSDDEHFYQPVGLQIQGPAYAGGILYDSRDNTAIFTGATFVDGNKNLNPTSFCLMGEIDMDSGNLETQKPRGTRDYAEACNTIAFDTNKYAAYAIGMAESNGNGQFDGNAANNFVGDIGGDEWEQAASGSSIGGLILQIDDETGLLGGNRILDHPTVYPVSIVTDPNDRDLLYVASVGSQKNDPNNAYKAADKYQNILKKDNHKFGSEFFLMIDQYEVSSVPISPDSSVPKTVENTWSVDFSTDGGEDVYVGGMVMAGNGDVLVVVGSTTGDGGPFDNNEGNFDMDGFIIKINPEDGQLLVGGGKASTRLDSVNKKDDYILNICNDRFDHDAIYVVGKSQGHIRDLSDADQPPDGSSHAFVAKVNLQTLRAEWLKHFTMSVPGDGMWEAEALACTVTRDNNVENIVYVGGTIRNGASLDSDAGSTTAYGKDDIFVAAMNGGTGEVNWIQQIGTSENDSLATSQGLDVDSFGNVIVYAETSGDFYGHFKGAPDALDLVVFTMNKQDGTYLEPATDGKNVGNDEPTTDGKNVGNDEVKEEDEYTPPVPSKGIPAIQTNDDAIPSYAGGMHYDKFTNAIYLTGASYTADNKSVSTSSQCLFGILTLPQLQWMQWETMGTKNAPEACSSISLSNYNGASEPIIVGSSEKSGLLDDLRTARRSSQYGMVLDLQNNGGSFDLIGGTVVDEENVQFPVKVLGDNEKVYLVSMASKSDQVQGDSERADSRKYPNLTTGGIEKFGSQYEILIERHTITHEPDMAPGSSESTMALDWRKPLETKDERSIFVSGMATIDDGNTLIIVGSTQGKDSDDFDGIMAKVTTDNGSFATQGDDTRPVAYFSSVSGANDWILSVCRDTDDDRFFYVTGATGGQMDASVDKPDSDVTVHAVVSKIQANNLNIIWTTQYGVTHASGTTDKEAASVGLGCAMVPDKGYLYIAGDVENGAILEGASESAGGDDIFVAMIDTDTGKKVWTKQVGSSGDDRIARGGGIIVDTDGNAVAFGDTTGSFLRMRDSGSSQTSDLFLMTFNQDDGDHENSMSKEAPTKKNKSARANPAPSEWFDTSYKKDPKFVGMVAGVILSALVLTISCCVLYRRTRARHELAKQNAIFTYLQQFSVEDIDLRKSPPGGWHGTYLNKLAHGVNTRATLPEQPYKDEHLNDDDDLVFDSPKIISSDVNDSLFMDNSSTPNLGGYSDYSETDDNLLRTRSTNDHNNFSVI